jgi:hypothetical protein
MRLRAVKDFVLGQPRLTSSTRAEWPLYGKARYSRSRPGAVAAQRPLGVFGVRRRLSRSANGPINDGSTYAPIGRQWARPDVTESGLTAKFSTG